MIKVCRDCFFSRNKYSQDETHWRCASPQNQLFTRSLVTGDRYFHFSASEARQESKIEERCGPEGKWFLTKEEFLKKQQQESKVLGLGAQFAATSSSTKKVRLEDL